MDVSQKYSNAEISSMGQVELESRAFIRAASSLNSIKEHWDTEQDHLMEALDKNRRLWTIIASAMKEEDCPQPPEIRNNYLAGETFTLADVTAAAHLSVIDYLGDVPWESYKNAKLWYSKIKSRPSFKDILRDSIKGILPAKHYANLDF